jgi:hypothetical protein
MSSRTILFCNLYHDKYKDLRRTGQEDFPLFINFSPFAIKPVFFLCALCAFLRVPLWFTGFILTTNLPAGRQGALSSHKGHEVSPWSRDPPFNFPPRGEKCLIHNSFPPGGRSGRGFFNLKDWSGSHFISVKSIKKRWRVCK